MQPSFTPAAHILGDSSPSHIQERILHNVWCPHCGDMTTMTDFTGEVHGRSLVLRGTCVTCRGKATSGGEGYLWEAYSWGLSRLSRQSHSADSHSKARQD